VNSTIYIIRSSEGYVGRYTLDEPYCVTMPRQMAASFKSIREAANFVSANFPYEPHLTIEQY